MVCCTFTYQQIILWVIHINDTPRLESTLLILISGIGALRLVKNNYYSTVQAFSFGIVEIYYNPVWGNICDDSYFGYNEANVICHQLAFTGVSSYGNSGSTTM